MKKNLFSSKQKSESCQVGLQLKALSNSIFSSCNSVLINTWSYSLRFSKKGEKKSDTQPPWPWSGFVSEWSFWSILFRISFISTCRSREAEAHCIKLVLDVYAVVFSLMFWGTIPPTQTFFWSLGRSVSPLNSNICCHANGLNFSSWFDCNPSLTKR